AHEVVLRALRLGIVGRANELNLIALFPEMHAVLRPIQQSGQYIVPFALSMHRGAGSRGVRGLGRVRRANASAWARLAPTFPAAAERSADPARRPDGDGALPDPGFRRKTTSQGLRPG